MKKAFNRADMIGKKYNDWLVLEYSHTNGKIAYYLCECQYECCGKKHVVDGRNLRNGRSKRCVGCGIKAGTKERIGVKKSNLNIHQMRVKYLYIDKKKSATKRKIQWALSIDEFESIIFKNCHYSGLPPSTTVNVLKNHKLHEEWIKDGWITYNGLDRLDSSKGYTIENVVPCNSKVNGAKNDDTTEDFLNWVKAIAIYQGWVPKF